MIPIDNDVGRDGHSKAILSTNKKALNAHRQKIKQNDEIKNLRTQVKELKDLLLQVINKE